MERELLVRISNWERRRKMNVRKYPRRLKCRWERFKVLQKYLGVLTEKIFGVKKANSQFLFSCLYVALGCCDKENTVIYLVS